MWFTKSITFLADKTLNDATATTIKCAKGVIHDVKIIFPLGCNALVNVAIFEGGHPIIPSVDGMTIKGNGATVSYKEFYEFNGHPFEITIVGWNEDTLFNHTIEIQVGVLPKAFLIPTAITSGIMNLLRSLLGIKSNDETT